MYIFFYFCTQIQPTKAVTYILVNVHVGSYIIFVYTYHMLAAEFNSLIKHDISQVRLKYKNRNIEKGECKGVCL